MNPVVMNVAIPTLSALLGFGGAVFGSYISADKAEDLWQVQEQTIQLKFLLNKRVELVERVSKISNLTPKYKIYQDYAQLQADLAKDFVNCQKQQRDNCVDPDAANEVTEMVVKRADLNAEFASTIQMVSLYYYGDAKKIANELGMKPVWWQGNEQLFKELIAAMLDEISSTNITKTSS